MKRVFSVITMLALCFGVATVSPAYASWGDGDDSACCYEPPPPPPDVCIEW